MKFLVLEERNQQPRILYQRNFHLKMEKENFSDQEKLRKFISNRLDLQEMLKGVLQGEGKCVNYINPYKEKDYWIKNI